MEVGLWERGFPLPTCPVIDCLDQGVSLQFWNTILRDPEQKEASCTFPSVPPEICSQSQVYQWGEKTEQGSLEPLVSSYLSSVPGSRKNDCKFSPISFSGDPFLLLCSGLDNPHEVSEQRREDTGLSQHFSPGGSKGKWLQWVSIWSHLSSASLSLEILGYKMDVKIVGALW